MIELRPHQQKAVDELGNGKILCGDVGLGKTLTALAYFFTKVCGGVPGDFSSIRRPHKLYVITTAKKRDSLDWEKDAIKLGIGKSEDASIPGITMVVDSWNNLGKYTEVENAFFIFDEQRLVGSGAWTKSFLSIAKRNKWILLSATPGDTWLDYIPVFIANGFYKNRTQFLREHVVFSYYTKFPKVERYLSTGKLIRYKRQLLVDMPYERHTVRHLKDIWVDYDAELFERVWVKRWNVFEKRPLRDLAELFGVARRVVNSDASRIEAVKKLMQEHPRLIVFYNFDYELELLRGLAEETSIDRCSMQLLEPTPEKIFLKKLNEPLVETTERTPECLKKLDHTTETKASQPKSSLPESSALKGSSKERLGTARSTSTLKSSSTKNSIGTSPEGSGTPTALRGKTDLERLRLIAGKGLQGLEKSSTESSKRESPTSSNGTAKHSSRSQPTHSTSSDKTATAVSSRTNGSDQSLSPDRPVKSADAPDVMQDSVQPNGMLEESPSSRSTETLERGFAVAEWNGHKHQEVPTTERWVYLVQYQAGSEGWNCITTDAMCFFSLTYSYKMWHQAHGRIDRLVTPFTHLYYYKLISKSPIDGAIWKSLKSKKSFNQASFGRKHLDI